MGGHRAGRRIPADSGHMTVSLEGAVLLDRLDDAVAPRRAVGQARVPLESLEVNEVVDLPGRARRLLTVLVQPGTNAGVRRTEALRQPGVYGGDHRAAR